jgi:hypothetical protein
MTGLSYEKDFENDLYAVRFLRSSRSRPAPSGVSSSAIVEGSGIDSISSKAM